MAKNCLIELQYDTEVEHFKEILEIMKFLMENMYLLQISWPLRHREPQARYQFHYTCLP